MITDIVESAKSDGELVRLFGIAREYADIYLVTRKRQKGCDGMGELAMIKEEFRETVDGLVQYCKRKGLVSEDLEYELDSAANELSNVSH